MIENAELKIRERKKQNFIAAFWYRLFWVLLGTITIYSLDVPYKTPMVLYIITPYFFVNIVSSYFRYRGLYQSINTLLMITLDCIVIHALIFITGGFSSFCIITIALQVILTTMLADYRYGLYLTAINTLVMALFIYHDYNKYFSSMLENSPNTYKLVYLFVFMATLITVNFLIKSVMGKLIRSEKEINDKNLLLDKEHQKSESLLLNILPDRVAAELKNGNRVTPKLYDSASILFTDFVGFTRHSERMTPENLIEQLDACFSQFDNIAARYGLEKIKTIGDSYMCAGGLPRENTTHAIDCVLSALDIVRYVDEQNKIAGKTGGWEIRIGINTGAVVAGVIGKSKFSYDVWGNTVNVASRMESSGVAGRVNISEYTYEAIKEFFDCEYRGKVEAKMKGEMDMYLVKDLREEYASHIDPRKPNEKFWQAYQAVKKNSPEFSEAGLV